MIEKSRAFTTDHTLKRCPMYFYLLFFFVFIFGTNPCRVPLHEKLFSSFNNINLWYISERKIPNCSFRSLDKASYDRYNITSLWRYNACRSLLQTQSFLWKVDPCNRMLPWWIGLIFDLSLDCCTEGKDRISFFPSLSLY